MYMEQKAFYVAPKSEFCAAKIRCSLLSGSTTNNANTHNSGASGTADGDNVVFDEGNGSGARGRKSESLGF